MEVPESERGVGESDGNNESDKGRFQGVVASLGVTDPYDIRNDDGVGQRDGGARLAAAAGGYVRALQTCRAVHARLRYVGAQVEIERKT